jgi:HPr kinase/phosphorylase
MSVTVHASCVAFGDLGVLIRGPSGCGKSDLVLRLIDAPDVTLVADDQVVLEIENGALVASPPASLAGKLEIRGQGIVVVGYRRRVNIDIVVDLVPLADIERMPEPGEMHITVETVRLPRLKLFGPSASAPARIRAFLKSLLEDAER